MTILTQKISMQMLATLVLASMVVNASPQAALAAQQVATGDTAVVQTAQDSFAPAEDGQAKRIYVRVPVTAYSSTPDQTDDSPFITASGTHVRDGVLAANFLPIGTRVKIPSRFGDQVFVVEDRMNARYNVHADIWMESRDAAKAWGIKYLTLEVYTK